LPSKELTEPDKLLARAFGHPATKGLAAPQFRAIRPGYHPWYLTENEGIVLAKCMDSVLEVCACLAKSPAIQYWQHEESYPEVVWSSNHRYRILPRRYPEPPPCPPEPAVLEEERLARFSKEDHAVTGILEIGHVYTGIPIGKQDERKGCLRAAVVAEAEMGFVHAIEVADPSESLGNHLVRTMLTALERGKFVPMEVRVNSENFRLLLSLLGERLGFPVRIMKELSTVDLIATDLLRKMGDPGNIEV